MPSHQHSKSKNDLKKNTSFPTKLSAKIDWLEFTIKNYKMLEVIEDVLALNTDEFSSLSKGRFGYTDQEKWENGNIFIMYNAIDDNRNNSLDDPMGVHVIISGTGCASYNAVHDIQQVILLADFTPDHNFTRIDIAVDDIGEKLIKFNRLHKQTMKGNYVTRWSKWDEVLSHNSADGKYIGQTIYFGSQTSEIFCRIYNKALEQKQKLKEKADEVPDKWTRLEMVYRKERANLVVKHMVRFNYRIGEIIRGTLQNYLRFVNPNGDKNKSRRPMIWWWERFISEAGRLKLTVTKKQKSIEDMENWIQKQIAPTLATIMAAKEGEIDWLYKSLSNGKNRLKRKHLEAIMRYTKEEVTR